MSVCFFRLQFRNVNSANFPMKIPYLIRSIIIGFPVGITLVDCVGYVARVDGISMQPALNPDRNITDYVFLNRWAIRSLNIKRGEIVSLISPRDPDQKIIKRVVGVQGDIVATLGYKSEFVRIPEGHCWVEGDHTGHSMDSNNFGPVSLGLLTAKASCIVWPPSRWQAIRSFLPESRLPLNVSKTQWYPVPNLLEFRNFKMRAISLVNRLEFDFTGNVLRKGITLGDIDNDGNNELIVGGENGEIAIFKGREKWKDITGLSFISCVAIGDIFNQNKNCLVVITADGWCHIYSCFTQDTVDISEVTNEDKSDRGIDQVDGQIFSSESMESEKSMSSDSGTVAEKDKQFFKKVHLQRIPANVKDILLGDIEGDGLIEMVLGLTDRVVRSYRWFNSQDETQNKIFQKELDQMSGSLVCLNKWECANQIGSVTLHHSKDGTPSLLVAQPGGTFMRISCQPEEIALSLSNVHPDQSDSESNRSETWDGSKIDYQFLGLSRMRNQNISTEILGDLNTNFSDDSQNFYAEEFQRTNSTGSSNTTNSDNSGKKGFKEIEYASKGKPYAVATLDGTIMLVQDEIILWAIAVDHQIFALTKLDVTGNGIDDVVACSWGGHTYILDQNKNSVRFQLDESVQAFESGHYYLGPDSPAVTCFVYVTFRNKIYLYYDIPLKGMLCRRYEPNLNRLNEIVKPDAQPLDRRAKKELVDYLLYGM